VGRIRGRISGEYVGRMSGECRENVGGISGAITGSNHAIVGGGAILTENREACLSYIGAIKFLGTIRGKSWGNIIEEKSWGNIGMRI
jgi:hypothetical protein